jgi:NADH-quinone oxidoreductase subunit G
MALIVINGKHINASEGSSIIEAAYNNGIDIPHFCWHPELSVSGNCRMCLVEVGSVKKSPDGNIERYEDGNPVISFLPKLQIACATKINDGMHVRTMSEPVIKAQEAVMEFFLINHPLDCPICDEAGQCKLQDYAFNHSSGESRFIEEKNHQAKRVSWGPNVLYDAERCISCSRCIRFGKEFAEQDLLTFVNRGDKVTIKVETDKEFDNPYSMNVIDICPVGALTSKDFRFKSRVWDMSFNESICTGCSRGCNIKLGVRNNEILRIEPATNMNVNKHWMCDYGRLNYENINNERLCFPMIKENGALIESNWDKAFQTAGQILKKYKPNEVVFIASAKASNEDNYLFNKFVKTIYKSHNIEFLNYIDDNFADNKLKTKEKAPNSNGLIELINGISEVNFTELANKVKLKDIKVIYIFDNTLDDSSPLFKILPEVGCVIAHCINKGRILQYTDVVFADSATAESEGTFVNINKRVQHFTPAIVTTENIRQMGMKMSRLDKFGAHNDSWTQHETRNTRQSWRTIQNIANAFGAGWNYHNSSDVFEEIVGKVEGFKGMNYQQLNMYKGLTLFKAGKHEEQFREYVSHYFKPE